ncbi:uncharacterized protein LOC120349411, partial [Nilaparvata lugens]|uniref:uncharacterized protein LOC120349411 n=1 Tax=Nilaparvata lugens TaxID=108931 RepID=UPI00193E328F
HGYRLPVDQYGVVTYMTVRFSARLPVMTYPLACLQSHPPTLLRVRNESAVLSDFLGDLMRRLPVIADIPSARRPQSASPFTSSSTTLLWENNHNCSPFLWIDSLSSI